MSCCGVDKKIRVKMIAAPSIEDLEIEINDFCKDFELLSLDWKEVGGKYIATVIHKINKPKLNMNESGG